MKTIAKKFLGLGLWLVIGIATNGCGRDQTSLRDFNYPDMVKVIYARDRIGTWDTFIDQLLPTSIEIRTPEVKKTATGYTFSFFFDDVYPVTQYDDYSNHLLAVATSDSGTEPDVSKGGFNAQILSYHGRQWEQEIQPGKVYKLAVILMIFYGGTPNHAGQVVVAHITIDTTSLK